MESIEEIRENGKREAAAPKPDPHWDCGHPKCKFSGKFSAWGDPEYEDTCDRCGNAFCRAHLIAREQESFQSGMVLVYRWCFACAEGLDIEEEWDEVRHEVFVAGYEAGKGERK
jgi:hypothetical protein